MRDAEIVVYSDATYASLPYGSSQGAFIVFIKGNEMVSPILWQSKKIPRVTKSSLASETLGVREAVDAGNLIANVMMEVYR